MRDSTIIYRSYHEALQQFPEAERLILYDAIFKYIFDGIEPDLKGMPMMAFILMKPNIDRSIKNYENGSKGGRPPKNHRKSTEEIPKKNQFETETKPNHNPNETKHITYKDKDKDYYKDEDKDKESTLSIETCERETIEYFRHIDKTHTMFLEQKLGLMDWYIYRKPNTNIYQSLTRMIYEGYISNQDWAMVTRTFNLTDEALWFQLSKFLAIQINSEMYKEWATIRDFKRHFVNWLNKHKT